jgi:predicted dehydrogenase
MVLAYADDGGEGASSDGAPRVVADDRSASRSDVDRPRKRSAAGAPRVGLIGPGGFAGRVIIPALLRAGVRLELVGGGAGPSAEAAGRTLGFARVATDAQVVIADGDVDAVVICTRHASHAELATQALQAGKHVFCEKPLGLSTAEVEQVCAAAASDGAGILSVGFNRRFSPHLRSLREFVDSGKQVLGSYRVSAGQSARDHWVHDLTQGGGRVLGEVCHFIDSLAFVAGSPVVEVHAYGYGESGLPMQSHDRVAVNLRFESGSVGTVLYVADGSPKVSKERLEVFTGSRTAILDDYATLEL